MILRKIIDVLFSNGTLGVNTDNSPMYIVHCSILASTKGPKMDQNGLKIGFYGGNHFCRTYAFGGDSFKWSQRARKPHNQFCPATRSYLFKRKTTSIRICKSFTAPSVWLINSKTVLTFEQNLIKTSTREMHTAVTILEVASGLSASKPKSGIKAFDDEIWWMPLAFHLPQQIWSLSQKGAIFLFNFKSAPQ